MDKRVKVTADKPGPRLPPDAKVAAYPAGLLPEMFSPSGMLGLADELPVMVAFVDRDLRYRFLNKTLADWFERPRAEILGKTVREMAGEAAYLERRELSTPATPKSLRLIQFTASQQSRTLRYEGL